MKKSAKILQWVPRIICILGILFISVFAVDAFGPGKTIWQQLGDFMIHMIPSFVLLAVLLIAWKWDYAGGIIFLLTGLVFSPLIFVHNYKMNHSVWLSLGIVMLLTFPFVLAGVLFMMSHYHNKKEATGLDAPGF